MMGTVGNSGKMTRFKTDPFYLYPIKEEMLDRLFIDREEEIAIASGLLKMKFADATEICAILGGIGVGKSSFLHYIAQFGKGMGYDVKFYAAPSDFSSDKDSFEGDKLMVLIDDVAKLGDNDACDIYSTLEKQPEKKDCTVFFTDTYDRNRDAAKQRSFTVSHSISLPRGMNRDKLRYFLEERMRRCLSPGERYVFPFSDEAIEMAATRSNGNLRSFLNYAKNGWMIATGNKSKSVGEGEMKSGMIIIDRAMLGHCDLIDMKILWHSTVGDINKSYLAHQCGIDTKTLDSRISDKLSELVFQKKAGKDMMVTSVYRYVRNGQDILEKTMDGLGISLIDVAGKE